MPAKRIFVPRSLSEISKVEYPSFIKGNAVPHKSVQNTAAAQAKAEFFRIELFFIYYKVSRNLFTLSTQFAPSEQAVIICLNSFVRTSPAAKSPSSDVLPLSSATI